MEGLPRAEVRASRPCAAGWRPHAAPMSGQLLRPPGRCSGGRGQHSDVSGRPAPGARPTFRPLDVPATGDYVSSYVVIADAPTEEGMPARASSLRMARRAEAAGAHARVEHIVETQSRGPLHAHNRHIFSARDGDANDA